MRPLFVPPRRGGFLLDTETQTATSMVGAQLRAMVIQTQLLPGRQWPDRFAKGRNMGERIAATEKRAKPFG
jgi:hypothetical protein